MTGKFLSLVCPHCQLPLLVPPHLLGQTIACSRCGQVIPLATSPPGPAPAGYSAHSPPAPPVSPPKHATSAALPPSVTQPPDEQVEEDGEEIEQKSYLYLGCLIFSAVICVLAGIAGMIALGMFVLKYAPVRPHPVVPEERSPEEMQAADLVAKDAYWWTDASKKSIGYRGVTVRIERVAIASPRFQSRGERLETGEPYLVISLAIENHTRPEVTYKSWYSYKFEAEEETVMAECVDAAGEVFELFPIPGAEKVEHHIHSEYFLGSRDSIADTLVFKLPPNYSRSPLRDLKLTLPAAAMEDDGFYRFRIPAHMIVDSGPDFVMPTEK